MDVYNLKLIVVWSKTTAILLFPSRHFNIYKSTNGVTNDTNMALYLSVPLTHNSVTLNWHNQNQDPEILLVFCTCALLTVTQHFFTACWNSYCFIVVHLLFSYPNLNAFCLFSSEGSNMTPAHHYPDFRLKTYAPLAFRYFRELFGIKPDDYLVSVEIHLVIVMQHDG